MEIRAHLGWVGGVVAGWNFFWSLRMKPNFQDPAVIVTKMYDATLWILPKVEKFPRSYRFTVGDRIATTSLSVLTLLVQAAYAKKRLTLIAEACNQLNSLRYLLRLAKDLKLMSTDSYLFIMEKIEELGRMAGGWQRQSGSTEE